MNLTQFLNPRLFPEPENIYLPLAKFSAANSAKMEQDIHDAIALVNARARDFSSNKSFYKGYLALISQAEAHAVKKQWPEAHEDVWEATFLVNRALESQASGRFRKWIGWYLVLWLLFLGYAVWWLEFRKSGGMSEFITDFSSWNYVLYVLSGALGGIVIAIWGLILHTSNLDFDRHFSVWYWFKPVLGAAMGLIAVVTVQAGLFTINSQESFNSQGSFSASANGEKILCIIAFLAGFSERFFIRIIDRLMSALFGGDQSTPTSSTSTATKATASGMSISG